MLSIVAQCLVNHGNEQQLAQRNKGNRGRGTRKRVSSHVKLPGNWKKVVRNDDNKDELFLFLGQECVSVARGYLVIVSTILDGVVSSGDGQNTDGLQQPC